MIRNLDLLAELETLDLSYNLIEHITGLEACMELKTLNLANNRLKRISDLHSN